MRGDASPPSRVSVPHRDLASPPSRFRRLPIENWVLDFQTKKNQPARINPKIRPNMVPNCGEDLLFFIFIFCLYLISREKHCNFRRRPFFFWSSLNLGDGITLISLKYYCRPNAFDQGCKSVPPCKLLQFKYWIIHS